MLHWLFPKPQTEPCPTINKPLNSTSSPPHSTYIQPNNLFYRREGERFRKREKILFESLSQFLQKKSPFQILHCIWSSSFASISNTFDIFFFGFNNARGLICLLVLIPWQRYSLRKGGKQDGLLGFWLWFVGVEPWIWIWWESDWLR